MSSKEYSAHKPINGKGREKTYRQSDRFIVCAGQRTDQEGLSPSSARMRSAVSKGGGNASLAGVRGGYGEA
jgi:hypothetical protein